MMRLVFALSFALATLLIASSSHATPQNSAGCVMNSDGSGYCYGNLYTFASSPNMSANFSWDVGNTGWFSATYNGKYYSCNGGANQTMGSAFGLAMGLRGQFWISWEANATCNAFYLYNGSSYANF